MVVENSDVKCFFLKERWKELRWLRNLNIGAFSCDEVFVITFSFLLAMAEKLCKEQPQISFGNSTKYSDFIDGKYFLRNQRLKGPYCSKKFASSKKKIAEIFNEISGIGFN